jgi:hypothetical protein
VEAQARGRRATQVLFTRRFLEEEEEQARRPQEVLPFGGVVVGAGPCPVLQVRRFLEGPGEALELQGRLLVVVGVQPALGPAEASASLLSRPNGK